MQIDRRIFGIEKLMIGFWVFKTNGFEELQKKSNV